MNLAFKIIAFVFLLNLSAGIMATAVPTLPYAISYSEDTAAKINGTGAFSGALDPSGGSGSNPDSFGDRVLDFITIGWYQRIKVFVQNYLFGVTGILERVFGPEFTPYKGYLNWAIFFTYSMALISLWVGKRLNKD